MKSQSFRRAIFAGLIATATLTVLMYLAPLAGMPRVDMASAIGGFLSRPADSFTLRWWIGLAVFLITGIVFAPVIFQWLAPSLVGNVWQRGLEWGVLLWGFGAVCVMVHLGLAFHEPFTVHPQLVALTSFLGHLVYGVILAMLMFSGAPARPRVPGEAVS